VTQSRGLLLRAVGFPRKRDKTHQRVETIFAGQGLNRVAGASISFIFTDQGEPGTSDTESMIISNAFNNVVLVVPTTALTFGNHQAHKSNE